MSGGWRRLAEWTAVAGLALAAACAPLEDVQAGWFSAALDGSTGWTLDVSARGTQDGSTSRTQDASTKVKPPIPVTAQIPAGSFVMGCDQPACGSDEKPVHTVTLKAFAIDVYEVTVADYTLCVSAGACKPAVSGGVCNAGDLAKQQHPINCIDWYQASEFCKWSGGQLPTEAQWEYAARGGLAGKLYPWGDEGPTCTAGQPNTAVFSSGGDGCGKGTTWPVGTGSSKNGYGLYDMAGNVWEWTADAYGGYPSGDQTDPTGPSSASARVFRGGSFYDGAAYLRAGFRYNPSVGNGIIGARCSRSIP